MQHPQEREEDVGEGQAKYAEGGSLGKELKREREGAGEEKTG